MGLAERILGTSRNGGDTPLAEVVQRQRWQMNLMEENLRTLESSMTDGEWRKLGANLEREFTRDGLDDLMSLSRAMYLSHPLIQRAVNITTYYTWGQGVEFSAADQKMMDDVVTPMITDDGNKVELYGHQARLLTDVDQIVDGNTFVALFKTDPVSARSIPAEEIRRIHRDPNDRNQVWFYRRRWTSVEMSLATGRDQEVVKEALYPDIGYTPTSKPNTIGGTTVMWDSPVIHQKIGGLKQMQFGIPGTYAALDWARAYKKFLEDWHTIVASLARFAWKVSTKGSKVDRVRDKMSTRDGDELTGRVGRDMPAGQAWVGVEGDQLTPIPKTGAHTSADDARPSRLMVGAAMDLPDTILSGDADTGNLATAKTLDRPTELAMRSRQGMWQDWHQRVFNFATMVREEHGTLGVPKGQREVKVTFPPILEHDQLSTVQAIVAAATLEGRTDAGTIPQKETSRMLMSAIGVEDVASALEDLDSEDRADLTQAVERLAEVLR